jgi:hypothetical protein
MPVPCPYCETNTHDGNVDICDRVFISMEEAKSIIHKRGHVISQAGNILLGANYGWNQVCDVLAAADYIEICDPKGTARKMKHGIAAKRNKELLFIETIENKLKKLEREIAKEEAMKKKVN